MLLSFKPNHLVRAVGLVRCPQSSCTQTVQTALPATVKLSVLPAVRGHCLCVENRVRFMSYSSKKVPTLDTDRDAGPVTSQDTKIPDIDGFVESIVNKAAERDVMIKSIPRKTLVKHINHLVESGFHEAEFVILAKHPHVFHKIAEFCKTVQLLREIGVEESEWVNIFSLFPNVFTISKSDLSRKVEDLYTVGFKTENMKVLLTHCPQILNMDISYIDRRVTELKKLFKTSDTFKLLCKTPQMLFCDLSEIEEKFHYVYQVMGVTQPQMMFSNLFSYPLEHIHTRHMFAVRAGFFKKSKRQQGQIDQNPKLDTLLDTPDEKFAKMFGDMTVADYRCFKKLLLLESKKTKGVDDREDED